MSIDTLLRVSLSTWIALLVRALDHDPSGTGPRLRAIVDRNRARITVDGETVLVVMEGDELVIGPDQPSAPVDGFGATTSDTVLALLAGDLEVLAAVEEGLIEIVGTMEATTRMLAAIELLIDGSSRVPALRHLAAAFIAERASETPRRRRTKQDGGAAEVALLHRLGLLVEDGGGVDG